MSDERVQSEAEIIGTYLAPLTGGEPGAYDLIDDCATLTAPAGCELVLKTDAVVAGVHFFADDAPADIAFKALAVNVSDLIAKGAKPLVWQLALGLPQAPGRTWLQGLVSGFAEMQEVCGIRLSGGDLVRMPGPLTLSITAIGSVPVGRMVRRGGGRAGDHIFVTGTIGDAALGLEVRRGSATAASWRLDEPGRAFLRQRYLRPELRHGAGAPLLELASAAMDISDGLDLDVRRMCAAAGLGGQIDARAVPLSSAAATILRQDPSLLHTVLTGGDDYEVLAAIPPASAAVFEARCRAAGVAVTRIGSLTGPGDPVRIIGPGDTPIESVGGGYDHFQAARDRSPA